MTTKAVVPVLQTGSSVAEKPENLNATFVNNIPETFEVLDTELAAGFVMQSEIPNETDFRIKHLLDAVVGANKQMARATVAGYERAIDGMAKLSCYRKTHTRDAVEAIFLQTPDGKIMAQNKKLAAEYLENHK